MEVPIHDQIILFSVKTPLIQIQEVSFGMIRVMAHEELSITSLTITRHSKGAMYKAPEHAPCVLPERIPVTIELVMMEGVIPSITVERDKHHYMVTMILEDGDSSQTILA